MNEMTLQQFRALVSYDWITDARLPYAACDERDEKLRKEEPSLPRLKREIAFEGALLLLIIANVERIVGCIFPTIDLTVFGVPLTCRRLTGRRDWRFSRDSDGISKPEGVDDRALYRELLAAVCRGLGVDGKTLMKAILPEFRFMQDGGMRVVVYLMGNMPRHSALALIRDYRRLAYVFGVPKVEWLALQSFVDDLVQGYFRYGTYKCEPDDEIEDVWRLQNGMDRRGEFGARLSFADNQQVEDFRARELWDMSLIHTAIKSHDLPLLAAMKSNKELWEKVSPSPLLAALEYGSVDVIKDLLSTDVMGWGSRSDGNTGFHLLVARYLHDTTIDTDHVTWIVKNSIGRGQ